MELRPLRGMSERVVAIANAGEGAEEGAGGCSSQAEPRPVSGEAIKRAMQDGVEGPAQDAEEKAENQAERGGDERPSEDRGAKPTRIEGSCERRVDTHGGTPEK